MDIKRSLFNILKTLNMKIMMKIHIFSSSTNIDPGKLKIGWEAAEGLSFRLIM